MRAPEDMPQRRRGRGRGSGRGRIVLLVAAAVLFVLFTSLRGLAGFYTDYLWFDSLELSQVWRGVLWSKVFLGAFFTLLFFAVCFVNLTIADRLAPKFRATGPEDDLLNRYHEVVDRRAGLVRGGVSLLFGLVAGVGVSAQWNEWILFRNGGDFGTEDAIFGQDAGFYVFKLPFITAVIDWAFASLVIILLITLVAHYLNGGIRLQSPFQRVTPQVKAHISVLLALLALIKAVDYWFGRYELTFSTRGFVDGATYTDVNAQLPALNLLLLISLLSCALFIVNIWRRGWVLPVVAVGLWGFIAIVAGAVYPTFIQRVRVEPQESSREAEYIGNNIAATQYALGLDEVDVQPFSYSSDREATVEAVQENEATIRNVRLLDPKVVLETYKQLQSLRGYYRFNELDVDRYQIEAPTGEVSETEVVLANRELNQANLPQQSWEGRHLAYTHGYSVALSPANATVRSGQPDFLVRDVPTEIDPRVEQSIPEISRPQLYFGENLSSYSIVGTTREEVDYLGESGETVPYEYTGSGGVQIDSFMRRAAFFLRFNFEWNLLFSDFITEESRIMYIRDIRERFEAVAPFLQFDTDPYPVVVDGRVVYMIDAYTTSNRFPNAERADTTGLDSASGLNDRRFNYVRNSVKGVVDTYEGTVKLYVVDPDDPIAAAYAKAFPDLFQDADEMDTQLRDHFRYPEDLFRVQTNMWGAYHITDPQSFYEGSNGWSVAQDPGTSVTTGAASQPQTTVPGQAARPQAQRINPVYVIGRLPNEEREGFMMLRSFVPVSEDDSKKQLTAFMVAKSDPDDYGRLIVYEMPGDNLPSGPGQVNTFIQQNERVSRQISLLNQQGSKVSYGDLILVPINDTILYVRPLYVSSEGQTPVPELKQVILVWGSEVVMEPTLSGAIERMFGVRAQTFEEPGDRPRLPDDPTQLDEPPDSSTTTTTTPTTPPVTGEPTQDPAVLLAEADRLFTEADAALRSGDWATYGSKLEEAIDKVRQAQQQMAATSTTSTTEPQAEA
jgi:uncharacterized membrane protein (UPF0182 family)